MAHISFRDIKKSFGPVDVIHGISFDIHDGEFVVLVGPSGCGKSTLLRMLAGLEDINAGEIAIDDRVINDLDSKDRDIAMVFQSYALYPHMTVYDNMAFSLKLRKAPESLISERVLNAAKILSLDSLLQRQPRLKWRFLVRVRPLARGVTAIQSLPLQSRAYKAAGKFR